MRLDAHQHFWNYTDNPNDYPWMNDELSAIQRNFLPSDLAPLLSAANFDGTIAVQAREMTVETDFLLELARDNDIVKGVVGWLDLCSPKIKESLDHYAADPDLKGFRMLIHDNPDPDFANSESHAHGIGLLESYGWSYDLLLRAIHIPSAIQLVDKFPNQKFVVDHISKPAIDRSDWDFWLSGMRAIAERPNVMCKLSGLVTEGHWQDWQPSHFIPFLDEMVSAFEFDRLMIGSDWPVCTLAADYGKTMSVVENWAAQFSKTEQNSIFGLTAANFYDAV